MTAEFRQKLLNWFTSMLLLLTTVSVGLASVWFLQTPFVEGSIYSSRLAQTASMMGDPFFAFALLFPPTLVWHLLDFIERTGGQNFDRISKFFASYLVLATTLFLSQIGIVLSMTGWFYWNSCDSLPHGALPHSCQVGVDPWIMALVFAPLLFSLLLCIGKAIVATRSRLIHVI